MHQDSSKTPSQSMLLIVHLFKKIWALAPGLVGHFMAVGRKATLWILRQIVIMAEGRMVQNCMDVLSFSSPLTLPAISAGSQQGEKEKTVWDRCGKPCSQDQNLTAC